MNWQALAAEKRARYELQHGEEDERSIVRRGNVAYAAGLALLMVHDDTAGTWFLRAAERWRASWDVGAGLDSWGRPVGAIKASLLARDDAAAERVRPLGSRAGRRGGRIADRALRGDARAARARTLGRCTAPGRVAARPAPIFHPTSRMRWHSSRATTPSRSSRRSRRSCASFETRSDYLEDVPVADTALVLERLAARRGFASALPASPTLPRPRTSSRRRPARTRDGTRS